MNKGVIYWNEELGQAENDLVGKKCANLGEMTGLGMPVPEGYALSLDASRIYLEQTGVQEKILELIKPIQSMEYPDEEEAPGITQQINKNVNEIAQKIEAAILEPEIPGELRNLIVTYYDELCKNCDTPNVDVAVRSSGVLSMPGQMETYLNVRGSEEVLRHIKIVWASAFTPRAIAWRLNHKDMDVTDSNIGIAILRMVDAQSAGVGFTANPATGDDTQVIIEGNWGFGESIVQGIVTPDTFQIDKETLEVTSHIIGEKLKYCASIECGTEFTDVPEDKINKPCFSAEQAIEIAKFALKLEDHFKGPQDFEWALDSKFQKPYMVQVRPAKHVPKMKTSTDKILDMMVSLM